MDEIKNLLNDMEFKMDELENMLDDIEFKIEEMLELDMTAELDENERERYENLDKNIAEKRIECAKLMASFIKK